MIGVTRKDNAVKGKITLEIPQKNLETLRNRFGRTMIDNLIMMGRSTFPESGPYIITLDKFHIQRAGESNIDRNQIVESNEFPMFFSFGKGAETHDYSMQILDGGTNLLGEDADWLDTFEDFYELSRPHNILDYEMDLTIYYSDRMYRGIWFNMSYQKNAELDKVVAANFKFFVIDKARRVQVG